MEDNFIYDEFEEFLQDQVRNQRMYPSDGVWREIDKKLHGEKRWPALTIAAVMLVTATALICVYFTPKPNIFAIKPSYANTSTPTTATKNNILNNLSAPGPFTKNRTTAPGIIPNTYPELIAANQVKTSDNNTLYTVSEEVTTHKPSTTINVVRIKTPQSIKAPLTVNSLAVHPVQKTRKTNIPENQKLLNTSSLLNSWEKPVNNNAVTSGITNSEIDQWKPVENSIKIFEERRSTKYHSKRINLRNRFSYLVYAAPSISYRKLFEDNSLVKENNGGPVGLNYVTDVNKVVRHKPGTGFEAGISLMYHLSTKVRIKSGFQFNMRQYSINAYRSNTELASITLVGTNRIDTINTLAIYRNNNGYYSADLVNRYYQISIPSGIEWEIIGNKRIQLNVAGTIQPTYLLNRNAYLLSTNFKNYTENPGMVRQWNINSNIEAFMSFKVGNYKWQLGPQLRYQPYSTFIPQYPIKEHLLDYGVKLGLSRSLF